MTDQPACTVPGCSEPAVAFRYFPTVVGYCVTHGNVLASFLTLIDLPATANISFDCEREGWEIVYRRARAG